MKISEMASIEREIPFRIYDTKGKVIDTKKITVKELPDLERISIRETCTVTKRNRKEIDEAKFKNIIGARMVIDAPFETEGGVSWKEMSESQKRVYLKSLSTNYSAQVEKILGEVLPEFTKVNENGETEEDLSETP